MYNTNSDIRFKTTMLKSSLSDYSDAYVLVRVGDSPGEKRIDERNKGVIFKNCAPFTNCKSEINNIEIDNAEDLDIVISYNII